MRKPKNRRRTRQSWALRAVLCVLIGAVSTVIVAWWLSYKFVDQLPRFQYNQVPTDYPFGWPARALASRERTLITKPDAIRRERLVRSVPAGVKDPFVPHHTFPCGPLFPGFALNTLFYATIALTLWSAPPAIRRRLRRARGRCPACGYNLKGAPTTTCPECGS